MLCHLLFMPLLPLSSLPAFPFYFPIHPVLSKSIRVTLCSLSNSTQFPPKRPLPASVPLLTLRLVGEPSLCSSLQEPHLLHRDSHTLTLLGVFITLPLETQGGSTGWEDPLEKGMATHSSVLAWRIPWTEEPGGPQSTGSQRVGRDWATDTTFW